MLNYLRQLVSRHFTRTLIVLESQSNPSSTDTPRTSRTRSRRYRRVQVPPSERFIWSMITLIIALIGVITLEAMHIIVTRTVNSEMLAVISGLIGSLATAAVMGKKQ